MAKRTTSSPVTTPRKKKKVSSDQQRLDSYFGSPPSAKVRRSLASESLSTPPPEPALSLHPHSPRAKDVHGQAPSTSGIKSITGRGTTLRVSSRPSIVRGADHDDPDPRQDHSRNGELHDKEIIDVDALEDDATGLDALKPPLEGSSVRRETDDDPTTLQATAIVDFNICYPALGIDPLAFDLSTVKVPKNTPIPYSFLSHTLLTLSTTRSRITIANALTNALRTICYLHESSLLPSLYLLSNSISPPYQSLELGLGHSIISKAIQNISGLTPAALRKLYNQKGDPGDVAFEAKANVRTLFPHPPLSVAGVYQSLLKIATAKGEGSVKHKQAIVEKLLVSAKGEEVRFLVRTLVQHIRVGAVRTTILTALARAMALTPPRAVQVGENSAHITTEYLKRLSRAQSKSTKKNLDSSRNELEMIFDTAEGLVKRVFVQHPSYDDIVEALLTKGLDYLVESVPLTLGIPLHPTLGSPMRSLDDVYERLENLPFVAEFKYDGQRAQVHAWKAPDGQILFKLFSRHLEDMTDKYPDIQALVQRVFATSTVTTSFILDGEIVAVDAKDGSLKSFQELSNRARKSVQIHEVTIAVCLYAFDLMYLDGESLLERPFRQRRELLRSRFPPIALDEHGSARFDHVESVEASGSDAGREAVEELWIKAIESRTEGLMIKLLDSGEITEATGVKVQKRRKKPLPATYEPDKRTSAWLKLKKDYVAGLGDSFDLVPVGAWHGIGRKTAWWSPVLLALRDPETKSMVALCKCMSGFTDAFYKEMKETYAEDSDNCSRQPLWGEIEGGYRPAVYFRPHEVWEIRGADITLSPVSVAAKGMISDDRGGSLRFPRFIRVRDDKSIEEASTPTFLADVYCKQQGKDQAGADEGQLIDPEMSDEAVEEEEEGSS